MPTLRMLLVIAATTLLAPATASCQNWPSRPIRIVVPFPAGGSTDVAARIIGEHFRYAAATLAAECSRSLAPGENARHAS